MARKTQEAADDEEAAPYSDLLQTLRAQWLESGRKGDFEFIEFVWGMTIVDQLIEREFKRFVASEFDLQPGDVRILLALRRGGPTQSLRPTDLFRSLLVTSGAITKQLNRLEARGLVRREFNHRDKRGWMVVLTKRGRALTETRFDAEAMPIAHASFSALTKPQRSEMLHLLHRIVNEIQLRAEEKAVS